MTIPGASEHKISQIIASHLTPSDFIRTPERLFGRDQNIRATERALNSPGRQVFIYGDRGVGKTSLALTVAHMRTSSNLKPIHVRCTEEADFFSIIRSIFTNFVGLNEFIENPKGNTNLGINIFGFGGNFSKTENKKYNIPHCETVNDTLNVIQYISSGVGEGELIVVVDEMDKIIKDEDRRKFADFIKNVPDICSNVKFIFCGIGSDLNALIGHHPSAGRVLEGIHLQSITHDSLWKIVTTPADILGVSIDRAFLIRFSQLSDGFPHYVHLIGDSLLWILNDDPTEVTSVSQEHYRLTINRTLERSEAVLKAQYQKATNKTKNTEDYEEALWALADKTVDRRQVTDIYTHSYLKFMMRRTGREILQKEKLNHRLLTLRKESHGRILVGHNSGWFSFRENIMRGYVRLKAEEQGVEIGN